MLHHDRYGYDIDETIEYNNSIVHYLPSPISIIIKRMRYGNILVVFCRKSTSYLQRETF